MKTKAMLLVLAAGWAVAATAAEPRCPLIPMGAITGKPDEQTVRETLEDPTNIEWLTLAVAQHAVGRRGRGGLVVVELFALGPSDMRHATQRQMIWCWA